MSRLCGWLAALVLTVALAGCDQSLSTGDAISPRSDVQITGVTVPGGVVLAPILSSGASSATTGVSAEFPAVGVNVAVFNGVSVNVTGFRIAYLQEDGVTPLGLLPITGGVARFLPAQFSPDGSVPSTATLTINVVSQDLRSFLAGPDALLGTSDDLPGTVNAVLTLRGTDINAHDFALTAQITITARPAAPAGS